MKIRLDKLMSNQGLCTRSEVGRLLRSGQITSLIEKLVAPSQKVEPKDIRFRGEPLDPLNLYILMYKPAGFVCSHEDKGELIFTLLPERFSRRSPSLNTVGRLDKDTTGALLLTDDGPLNHSLLAPAHHVAKFYEVFLEQPLEQNNVELLEAGGWFLDGDSKPLLPAKVSLLAPEHVLLTLTEGRYHQVKRMFSALGNRVVRLHRSSFAGLTLDGLSEGSWRFLDPQEVQKLKG